MVPTSTVVLSVPSNVMSDGRTATPLTAARLAELDYLLGDVSTAAEVLSLSSNGRTAAPLRAARLSGFNDTQGDADIGNTTSC